MIKLDAKQLRDSKPSSNEINSINRNPLYIIVDNVLDTYNVGAIFRLADAAAVSGVYLVGQTNIPTDEKVGHKIHKASVGSWKWTPWYHVETVKDAVDKINNPVDPSSVIQRTQDDQLTVVAIEQDKQSVPYTKFDYSFPLALVLGHETEGVSKESLKSCDAVVEIPMFGVNKSLNVMISLAIVMWHVIEKTKIGD